MHFNPEKKNQLEKRCFQVLQTDESVHPQFIWEVWMETEMRENKRTRRPHFCSPCKESCFREFSHAYRYHVYNIRITITKQISSVLCRKLMRSSDGSKRFAYLLAFFKSKFICMHLWMIYIEIRSACIIQKPAYFTDNSGSHSTLLHFLFSSFSVYQSFFSPLCFFFVVFTLPFTVFLTHVM